MAQVCLHSPSFNSRTRMGATVTDDASITLQDVSIHAPVWVRPVPDTIFIVVLSVSIHAPVWVRLGKVGSYYSPFLVSIHAPVWVRQHTCQSLATQGLKWHFVRTPNHFTKFIDISPCKPQ